MITYQRDYEKKYDADIKKLLRAHNSQFSNILDSSKTYVYVLEGGTLVGALNVNYFWDWVSIGEVLYKDREVLKHLIKNAWDFYEKKALGMKFFTPVRESLDDFVSTGFTLAGIITLTVNETFYYADLKSFTYPLQGEYEVLIKTEAINQYQEELDTYTKSFNEEHQIYDASEIFDVAALDGERCIGGLQSGLFTNMLYIDRLVVEREYRKQKIGTTLTLQAIDYAKRKGMSYVMLGTVEFQARGFYEKLGFEVVFQRENNPRGNKMFLMLLNVKGHLTITP